MQSRGYLGFHRVNEHEMLENMQRKLAVTAAVCQTFTCEKVSKVGR